MQKYALALVALLLLGCGGAPEADPVAEAEPQWQRYELRGEVLQIRPDAKAAVIDHQAVGDWMDAMRMSFSIPHEEDLAKIQEGDHITATLVANGYAEFYVENIEVVDSPTEAEESEQ